MENKFRFGIILFLIPLALLAACSGSGAEVGESESSIDAAMVDGVVVEFQGNHYYAIVNGFYPDSCTQISEVQQEIGGSTFKLTLSTAKPGDLMCAQMLTEFQVSLLLETGGLLPGEYAVEVNERTTNFTLGDQ